MSLDGNEITIECTFYVNISQLCGSVFLFTLYLYQINDIDKYFCKHIYTYVAIYLRLAEYGYRAFHSFLRE
jgi:hypothetical protein